MNYIRLPEKNLLEVAKNLKNQYGLIIPERPAGIKIDEFNYGKGWNAWEKTYLFSVIEKNGSKKIITVQNGIGLDLYAITKAQYKSWKGWKIVSELMQWDLERFVSGLGQLAYKLNIISLTKDFNKYIKFYVKYFKGDCNG